MKAIMMMRAGGPDVLEWPEVTNGPFFLHNGTKPEHYAAL